MNIIEYKNKANLEIELADTITKILKQAIIKKGRALLLVSGGSTPKNLFNILSEKDLEWQKVIVGLVDERFVSSENEKSNEKLVKENLIKNKAINAAFKGLVFELNNRQQNLIAANQEYKVFANGADVCVLGMGIDGHTASLFPKDEASQKELMSEGNQLLLNTQADVVPFERVSCSKYLIRQSKKLILMITGEEKIEVLNQAKEKHFPIMHFLETSQSILEVHYSKYK